MHQIFYIVAILLLEKKHAFEVKIDPIYAWLCHSLIPLYTNIILNLQEECGDIYSSIVALRDRSEELLEEIEVCERRGDRAAADRKRQELSTTETQLLEKTEERKER